MNSLPKLFENYLKITKKVSGKTLRNYRADLLHFLTWAYRFLNTRGHLVTNVDELLPHFTSQLISFYKGAQLEKGIPDSTTNRRLSTLRNFSKFLVEEKYISQNPMEVINNLKTEISWDEKSDALLADFVTHLENEGVTPITARNYSSDIRQFLAWTKIQTVNTNN